MFAGLLDLVPPAVLVQPQCYHQSYFQTQQTTISNRKALKTHCTLSVLHQTTDRQRQSDTTNHSGAQQQRGLIFPLGADGVQNRATLLDQLYKVIICKCCLSPRPKSIKYIDIKEIVQLVICPQIGD